ncbi:MAG: copper chaperone PCu(A)C [Spirochaetia bacterium]|nr:copper chaperone PCu(A)C [Spirochaetia bacterium]
MKKSIQHMGTFFLIATFIFIFESCNKKKESLKIENAWVTESIPGSGINAAYMKITNLSDKDETLLSIDCDNFETAEFHSMTEEGGVMKMNQMDSVLIKPGAAMVFEPGGAHIMLLKSKHDLKAGQKISLNLHFQNAGIKSLTGDVKKIEDEAK